MKITIGIINYNRLYYLKSVAKSLMDNTKNNDVELICIDDDSIEKGTKEYLKELEKLGWIVINQKNFRKIKKETGCNNFSHISPFSEALNILHKNSTGELIIPVQGDGQVIRDDWLDEVINLVNNKNDIGCICYDAQRKIRLKGSEFDSYLINGIKYFSRKKSYISSSGVVAGSADCVFTRELLDRVGGWSIGKGINSENDFVAKVENLRPILKRYYLYLPAAVAIITDKRGTNARIRGNKIYGDYWQAENDLYYKYITSKHYNNNMVRPYSIEEVAIANGNWELPLDENGRWKKNPIEINENTPYTLINV